MSLAANAVAASRISTSFAGFDGSFMVAVYCPGVMGAAPSLASTHGGAGGASEGSDRTRVDGVWCCLIAFPAPASARAAASARALPGGFGSERT